jgi:putative nucleotidyltransferase with HDIG domain
MGPEIKRAPYDYKLGDIARSTIRASADTTVEDKSDLEERRSKVIEKVLPIYDYYPERALEDVSIIAKYFNQGRQILQVFMKEKKLINEKALARNNRYRTARKQLIERLSLSLPIKVDQELLIYHIENNFNKKIQDQTIELLKKVTRFDIVGSKEDFERLQEMGFIKRYISGSDIKRERVTELDQIKSMDEIASILYQESVPFPVSAIEKLYLRRFVRLVIRPNLEFNYRRTEEAKERTALNVEPIYYKIKKGEVIVREGDIIEKIALAKIYGLRTKGSRLNYYLNLIGLIIILIIFTIALKGYCDFFIKRYLKIDNLFILFNSVLLTQVLLLKLSFFIAETMVGHFMLSPFNKIDSYYYALPYAAGAVLLTSLANQQIAIILSVTIATFTGLLAEGNFFVAFFALISCLAGIYGIRHYRERSAILKAALMISLVNVISVTAINLFIAKLELEVFLFEVFMAFLGGFMVAFVVSFLVPAFETMFGIATDIKLLELSSMDRQLLRELTLTAPGTYQHSVMLGMLAEAAATEIEANALFCRVAALYHDIGKVIKPDYFVENNSDAPKLHRKQKPHMSALILVNHVKKGMQIARDNKIPQSIIDTIPQHHGTRLISSFYELAKKQSDPDIDTIEEDEFRYPGPKPQSKEAAIIMIADSVEAASRTLKNPVPHKIRSMVEEIVHNIFVDGQLDECQLTFIDLRKITDAIVRKLTTIFHGRIEYSQFNFNKPKEETKEQTSKNEKSA